MLPHAIGLSPLGFACRRGHWTPVRMHMHTCMHLHMHMHIHMHMCVLQMHTRIPTMHMHMHMCMPLLITMCRMHTRLACLLLCSTSHLLGHRTLSPTDFLVTHCVQ
jgi:hypothetical protein